MAMADGVENETRAIPYGYLTVQKAVYHGGVAAEPRAWDDAVFPALLRAAWAAYGAAIRQALTEVGCDDIPRNGLFVLGAIAHTGAPLGKIVLELGMSKQAAGQLVDTLVARRYLDRSVDPSDRRRLTIRLTRRGEAAAAVIRSTISRIDALLVSRVGPEYVAHARATLAALAGGAHTDDDG
jgi:DNA-binding MarR family transcriptional regulator